MAQDLSMEGVLKTLVRNITLKQYLTKVLSVLWLENRRPPDIWKEDVYAAFPGQTREDTDKLVNAAIRYMCL